MKKVVLLVGALVLIGWCASLVPPSPPSTAATTKSGAAPLQPSVAPAPGVVSKDDWSGEWPFTVDSGRLQCEFGSSILFIANGTKYGLNGRARGQLEKHNWRDSREIIRKNEYGGLPDVSRFIALGRTLCDR
jgi:hypothetical protein